MWRDEPNEEDYRGARFLVRQLDTIEDKEKRVRFMAFVVRDFKMDTETHKEFIEYLYTFSGIKKLKRPLK